MKSIKVTYKDLFVYSMMIYYICLPLGAMNIGAIGSVLRIIAILPIGISFILGRRLRLYVTIVLQFAFTILSMASIIWSNYRSVTIDRVITYWLLFLLLIAGSAFDMTERDEKLMKVSLLWSSRITAMLMLFFSKYVQGRLFLDGRISEDPNYLCAYLSFGMVYSVSKVLGKNGLVKKLLYIAELAIYIYLVLATGSRGGLLAVGAGVAAYILTFGENGRKYVGRKLLILLVLVLALLVLMEYLPEELSTRFSVDNVVESGGSGRTEIWMQAFDLFSRGTLFQKFFGYGTATISQQFTQLRYSNTHVAHNIFVENLVELGIVGVLLYASAIGSFAFSALKHQDKFSFGVICCMIALSLSTSLYAFKPYFGIMGYIIMLQNRNSEQQR